MNDEAVQDMFFKHLIRALLNNGVTIEQILDTCKELEITGKLMLLEGELNEG